MIVLAPALADQTREVDVAVDVLAHLLPQTLERPETQPETIRLIDIPTRQTYGTLPVKLMPARCGEAVMASPKTGPSAGMKLTTPGGTPASLQIWNMYQLERRAVSLGFHSMALPCDDPVNGCRCKQCTYHEGRCVGEVAADGGEVEWRDGGDEAVDAAVAHRVLRLLRVLRDGLVLGGLFEEECVQSESTKFM